MAKGVDRGQSLDPDGASGELAELGAVRQLLDELVERIARLEAGSASPESARSVSSEPVGSASPEPGRGELAEVFWALDGLRRRFGGSGAVVYAGNPVVAAGPVEWQFGLTVDALLAADWSAAAPALAALGHPVRLALLHAVLAGAETTTELADVEGLGTTGQLYHHLSQLVAQGWLAAQGRGRYCVPADRVVPILVAVTAARGAL